MGNNVSKYEVIKRALLLKIDSMEYKPNQVLPSESELCEMYQVSRITVRRAVDELVKKISCIRSREKAAS